MRMDTNMPTPTLTTYITDLTNGCSYLDQLIADESTDQVRINEIIKGIEYQLRLSVITESSEDLTLFNSSVTAAKTYLAGLGE